MNGVYFDCIGGASGNMLLGALLDLGAPLATVQGWLEGLGLPNWKLRIEPTHRGSIGATHVTVDTAPEHVHRHLRDIERIVQTATLPDPVKAGALAVFRRLAEAEARVHRTSVDDIHFHEVGAIDAIIDIVGTVAALHSLGIEQITASTMPMGHGLIECAHGTFPNPPPATVELLKGVPTRAVDVASELVTPTGAALLVGLGATFGPLPAVWDAIGYGAGSRTLPFPNVVRVLGYTVTETPRCETLIELETNIDDTSPQVYGPLMEALFEQGALDVGLTAMQMKKGRPGTRVWVLCRPADAPVLRGLLLTETTTLGVREKPVVRYSVDRRMEQVGVGAGTAGVKLAFDAGGRVLKVIPEFADCLRLARASNQPVQRVVDEVRATAWKEFGQSP